MQEVRFYQVSKTASILFVVIVARYEGNWIFCKHKLRDTWEFPGGHVEVGEQPMEAARRELYEESGAIASHITPVSMYSVKGKTLAKESKESDETYGMLYYAEIDRLDKLPKSEMECIQFVKHVEEISTWTYPQIQPLLFQQVNYFLSHDGVKLLREDEKCNVETILRELSAWFGIEDARLTYVNESRHLPVFAYVKQGVLLGLLTIKETSADTLELYVMGIHPSVHRQGIGRKIVQVVKQYAIYKEYTYMQVKTLSPAVQDVNYLKTYAFYRKMGFCDVEVLPLWDEYNPCLLMIQKIS